MMILAYHMRWNFPPHALKLIRWHVEVTEGASLHLEVLRTKINAT